jgi:hypothetical protein
METIEFRGLVIEVEISSYPATGPTFSCGGTPAEWDMEISSVSLGDAEELSDYLEIEDVSEVEEFSTEMLEILANNWWEEISEEIDD